MNHLLGLALLATTTLTACNQCDIKEGSYTSAGGSEQSTNLILSADNTFVVSHETWQPGHYEKRDTSQLNGEWACTNKRITLNTQRNSYNAELVVIGENPLGLDAASKALLFVANTSEAESYLSKQLLYPDIE